MKHFHASAGDACAVTPTDDPRPRARHYSRTYISPRFDDDAMQANLTIGAAEEITLAEGNRSTIDATAPEMSGYGEDALENFAELEPAPFLEDAPEIPGEIEVGRDRDADIS